MNTPTARTDARNERELADEHAAPGGAAVNRAATVATSAALGGVAAGAMLGAVGGPVGAALGAAVGALAAGVAGNAVAASVDRDVEQSYWREHFAHRPYAGADADFDDFGPAYDHGVGGYLRNQGKDFDDVEDQLASEWATARGASRLDWERARPASREAWQRVSMIVVRPGE